MKKDKACGTIIINDNKVLLIRQQKGHLSFPKGHMENNETEKETAIRETKEETNLDVEIIDDKRFINEYTMQNGIEKEVIFFLAKPLTFDIIVQEEEVSEYLWVNLEDMPNYFEFDNTRVLWDEIIMYLNN